MRIVKTDIEEEIELYHNKHRVGCISGVCYIRAVEFDIGYETDSGLLELTRKDGERIAYLWVDLDCWRKFK